MLADIDAVTRFWRAAGEQRWFARSEASIATAKLASWQPISLPRDGSSNTGRSVPTACWRC